MSDSEILIDAENLGKKFCRSLKRSLWYGIQDIAKDLSPFNSPKTSTSHQEPGTKNQAQRTNNQQPTTNNSPALRAEEFWALQNVSFQLRRGECLGLIGHNGAGKSTLLKILNGLIRPDTGRLVTRGRIGALIELSAGFNPVLTGRENVYNRGAVLGFSREEIAKKFDAIVEYSEIGDFIDMPVQNYSSGMQVRLGFSVTSQMEPDILIIDEVLAVGDVGFRFKCINTIRERLKTAACIFVSHSMPQVANLCTRVMHLHDGRNVAESTHLDEVFRSYYDGFDTSAQTESGTLQVRPVSTTIRAITPGGEKEPVSPLPHITYLGGIELLVACRFDPGITVATIQLVIWNQEMFPVADVQAPDSEAKMKRLPIHPDAEGKASVRVRIDGLEFNNGRFSVSLILMSPDGAITYCRQDRAAEFMVESNSGSACIISRVAEWEVVSS